jgi:hypothetical protein
MTRPAMSGAIGEGGVLEILVDVEERRTTGVLHFESDEGTGELELVAGQLAVDQKQLSDGRDPVEVFLGLREGTYEVLQRLPILPVSKGDAKHREGSLNVHVPADVMNYCERAGLTGTLVFENEGREALAIYDRGELTAIRVDGSDDAALHDVFSWEDGTFRVEAHSEPPPLPVDLGDLDVLEEEDPTEREPTIRWSRKRATEAGQFLRVVEVALGSILEEREKRRSPSRTGPPMPPQPAARRPESLRPADEKRPGPRVKVIYLGGPNAAPKRDDSRTRHVATKTGAEDALPDAAPERRPREDEMAKKKPKKRKATEAPVPAAPARKAEPTEKVVRRPVEDEVNSRPGLPVEAGEHPALARGAPALPLHRRVLGAAGWVAVLIVIFFVALWLLANLPPL